MTYSYMLHDLTIRLPFSCPLLPAIEDVSSPDIRVSYGQVPTELSGAALSDNTWKFGYCWSALPGQYLLRGGKKSGRFLVENGNLVTVELNAGAEGERILFHLLHPVTASLFRHRGYLVLHSSTAGASKGAISLCGKSMAGKSTTLAVMLQNGCTMISDDITILRFGENSRVEVVPGTARMHLWDDAVQGIGLNASSLSRHPVRRLKASLTAPGEPCRVPVPLLKLCIIEPSSNGQMYISQVEGADKFNALMDCIYGPLFKDDHPGLFKLLSATCEQVEFFRICRPEGIWTVDEIVKAVLDG
jgi:hypothetical protein